MVGVGIDASTQLQELQEEENEGGDWRDCSDDECSGISYMTDYACFADSRAINKAGHLDALVTAYSDCNARKAR